MGISKQAFYEGAALYLLARTGGGAQIQFDRPFYVVNRHLRLFVKYSTKGRSPWGFTFSTEEQSLLKLTASTKAIIIGLVCGADGVAALTYDDYVSIAMPRRSAIHIGCSRHHNQHYEISGPDGALNGKIPPSAWQKIFCS
jgi:hypothetical protein